MVERAAVNRQVAGSNPAWGVMSELIPIGTFNISVFAVPDSPGDFISHISVPGGPPQSVASWIEAAATLSGYVARHSNIGYEQTLEIITERTMLTCEESPNLPNSPNSQTPSNEL